MSTQSSRSLLSVKRARRYNATVGFLDTQRSAPYSKVARVHILACTQSRAKERTATFHYESVLSLLFSATGAAVGRPPHDPIPFHPNKCQCYAKRHLCKQQDSKSASERLQSGGFLRSGAALTQVPLIVRGRQQSGHRRAPKEKSTEIEIREGNHDPRPTLVSCIAAYFLLFTAHAKH